MENIKEEVLMIKRFLKNEKGLTLIELLVVIVILGIISAIAIPAVGGLISKTEDDAIVAEAVQIINAAKLYVASEDPDDGTGTALTDTKLGQYLENVDDAGYTVTATKDTNGAYSYTISNHDAVPIVDTTATDKTGSVSEDDLNNY
jgi:type IV pilus assembly protein PilA